MIFSIGYGPDENGKITMNFGPLNKQGGGGGSTSPSPVPGTATKSSPASGPGDIPESVTPRAFGTCAATSTMPLAAFSPSPLDTAAGGDAESPFEESVISVMRSWGYELIPQVGTAGYRIDIGVRHPAHPGVYALGIECDGVQYHSSKAARDRDRLREKFSAASAGTCTASGAPPGTGTATAKNASSAPPLSGPSPRPFTGCWPVPACVTRTATPSFIPKPPVSIRPQRGPFPT